jgi:hypothetical protein
MEPADKIHPTLPARYQVRLQGQISADWSDWLSDLDVTAEGRSPAIMTVLTGTVKDQAALFGLLSFIRDLGIALISVTYLPESSFNKEKK